MFLNFYFNKFPFIIINKKDYTINKISKSFYDYIDIKINNNFFYYINNNQIQNYILEEKIDIPVVEMKIYDKIYYFKIKAEYKKNEIILLLTDITNLYENKDLKNKYIDELQLKNKNINKEINQLFDVFNEMDFIFCIFNKKRIIKSNNFFDYLFQNKTIEEILDDDYLSILYQLDVKNNIKNKTFFWKKDYYELFLSKKGDIYYLLGHNINKILSNENELKNTYEIIINLIGEAVHKKSKFTNNHINNVIKFTRYLTTLYKENYGLFLDSDVELLSHASALHDIGKLLIPSKILEKKGKLTKEEMEIMKTHTIKGKELIDKYSINTSRSKLMSICSIVALEHHEKWNGQGYPYGKKGNDIHLYARIVSLADVLEALMVKRPYKEPWPKEKLITFLKEEKSISFDPMLCEIVIKHYDDFYNLTKN